MEPLQPGDPKRISSYEILNRLGAGGMGQVYLGRSASGRRVAVKVIRSELTSDPEFRTRFRREVTAMKAVSGFFTAPVVDADPDGTPAWLATAFVPGPSLSEAVRDRGPMPQQDVLVLAAGLAEALSAIHREGLTHRDLKPANVLLADDGPRVIDFGLAVTATSSAVTQAGTVVGTPSFMSPEQINGKPVGPSSDIFSLGSVLVHAATGRTPYGEGGTMELMYRVVNNEPDLTGISGTLLQLVSACLHKDPAQRPTPARILQVLSDGAGVEATAAMGWVPPKLAQTPPAPRPVQHGSGPRPTVPTPFAGPQHGGGQLRGAYTPSPAYPGGGAPAAKSRTAAYVVAGGLTMALSGGGSPSNDPTTQSRPVTPGVPVDVDVKQLITDADAAKFLKAGQSDLNIGPLDTDDATMASRDETWDVKAGTSQETFLNTLRIQAVRYKDPLTGPKKAASDYAQHTSGGTAYDTLQVANTEKAVIHVAPTSDKDNSVQSGTVEILRGNLDVIITFTEMKVSTLDARGDLTSIAVLVGGRLPAP